MRAPSRPFLRLILLRPQQTTRHQSTTATASQPAQAIIDPHTLLSKPTWSIRSLLLPSTTTSLSSSSSSPPQQEQEQNLKEQEKEEEEEETRLARLLPHLHRLSSLPPPADAGSAARALATLRAQLRFVRAVRAVDTDGVEPLRTIGDETAAGLREAAVTTRTEAVRAALAEEEAHGRWKRPRRRPRQQQQQQQKVEEEGGWDVLGCAAEKAGRYFVVRSGKVEEA